MRWTMVLLAAAGATPADAAYYSARGSAQGSTSNQSSPPFTQNRSGTAPQTAGGGHSLDAGFEVGEAGFSASAEPGRVRAVASGSARTSGPRVVGLGIYSAAGSAEAQSLFQDTFAITAPGFANGTVASMRVELSITGDLSYSTASLSDSYASWTGTVYVNEAVVQVSRTVSAGGRGIFPSGSGTIGRQTITVPVRLGAINDVQMLGYANARAIATAALGDGISSADMLANLGNTVSWQRIVGLTVAGAPVTDFTAISPTSGFDFRRGLASAVPEATTWAMLVAGFGLTGAAARRRPLAVAA